MIHLTPWTMVVFNVSCLMLLHIYTTEIEVLRLIRNCLQVTKCINYNSTKHLNLSSITQNTILRERAIAASAWQRQEQTANMSGPGVLGESALPTYMCNCIK